MNDSELEALLRKYRPAGPPAELRTRILAMTPAPRIWPWLGGAAALLISTVTFHFASRHEATSAGLILGPSAVVRVTDDLTAMLGGDSEARERAELIVVEHLVRGEIASTAMEDGTAPEGGQQ